MFAAADVSHLDIGYEYHRAYPAFDEQPLMENLHSEVSDEDRVSMAPLDDFVEMEAATPFIEDIITTTATPLQDEHGVHEEPLSKQIIDLVMTLTNRTHSEGDLPNISSRLGHSEEKLEDVSIREPPEHVESGTPAVNPEGVEEKLEDVSITKHQDCVQSETPDVDPEVIDEKKKNPAEDPTPIDINDEDDHQSPKILEEISIKPEINVEVDLAPKTPEEISIEPAQEHDVDQIPENLPLDGENIFGEFDNPRTLEDNLVTNDVGIFNRINSEDVPGHVLTDDGYFYRDPRKRY